MAEAVLPSKSQPGCTYLFSLVEPRGLAKGVRGAQVASLRTLWSSNSELAWSSLLLEKSWPRTHVGGILESLVADS